MKSELEQENGTGCFLWMLYMGIEQTFTIANLALKNYVLPKKLDPQILVSFWKYTFILH